MEEEQKEQEQKKENSKMKKFIGPIIALLIVAGAGYWGVTSGNVDLSRFGVSGFSKELVAKVNGEGIEKRMFDTRFQQLKTGYEAQGTVFEEENTEQLRKEVLDGMVNEQLLLQYGNEQDITAADEQVEQEYQQILSQAGGEEEFVKQLALQNATLEDVREAIARNIVIEQIAEHQATENEIEITEEEIQQAYDEAVAQGAEVPPLEEVRGDVESYLKQQRVSQLMQELITKLREESTIEILI